MEKKYLVGLDIGTTSLKGILIDAAGEILATSRREYMLETSNEYCELDPEVYWENTLFIIKELLLQSMVKKSEIVALSFSSQGETIIPVSKDGKPLSKAIVWLDNRSAAEAETIQSAFGVDELLEKTGQPEILPLWPATRILWYRNNKPDIFENVHKYLLVEDYLIYKFSGIFCTEQSLVSSTLYYDIVKKQWWKPMLDFLGINEDKLPEVHSSGTFVGEILKEIAIETGLPENLKIITGAYDHAAGAIGSGNIHAGCISETTGASMAMCVTLDYPVLEKSLNLPCQCHAVPGKFFLLPYGQTAGMVLKWFKDQFCAQDVKEAEINNEDVYDLLTAQASCIPIGSDGLLMLPHLMGAGSPEFNPLAKGLFIGISLNTTKAHFIRAIMESIACMIYKNIENIRNHQIPVAEIRALGGGAKSILWNQMKADLSNIPLITLKSTETASMGAAILAGLGAGVFQSIEEACAKIVHKDLVFHPNKAHTADYRKIYEKYIELYEIIRVFWK